MTESNSAPRELSGPQRMLLAVLALLLRSWWATLRFRWDRDVQEIIDAPPKASVVILWHNRLFAAPAFFRKQFSDRQLATLISASGDGAWLSGLFRALGMTPIRGSHYKRGAQAVREMIAAHEAGFDIAVTPDGSRGPIYDFKPGAVAVALKTGAPFVLLSLNPHSAIRLKTWDKFYLPVPFSRIDAAMELIHDPHQLGGDPKAIAKSLQERMMRITRDLPGGE